MRRFNVSMGTNGSRRRKAAAAVEMALILPVLCSIAAITIDYSLLFYHWTTISVCAYNGACYASLNPSATNSAVSTAALVDATNLTSPSPTVSAPTFSKDANNNSFVTVTVSYTYQAHFVWPGMPSTVPLTRSIQIAVTP